MVKFMFLPLLLVVAAILVYKYPDHFRSFLGKHYKLILVALMGFAFGVGLVIANSGINISIL